MRRIPYRRELFENGLHGSCSPFLFVSRAAPRYACPAKASGSLFLHLSCSHLGFAEDTPSRQIRADACFRTRLIAFRPHRRYSASTKSQTSLLLFSADSYLWLRRRCSRLGPIEPTPASAPDLSHFGLTEDTPPRRNRKRVCFCFRLIRIFGFAEDTPARQNASELAFALAYSYLCHSSDRVLRYAPTRGRLRGWTCMLTAAAGRQSRFMLYLYR